MLMPVAQLASYLATRPAAPVVRRSSLRQQIGVEEVILGTEAAEGRGQRRRSLHLDGPVAAGVLAEGRPEETAARDESFLDVQVHWGGGVRVGLGERWTLTLSADSGSKVVTQLKGILILLNYDDEKDDNGDDGDDDDDDFKE